MVSRAEAGLLWDPGLGKTMATLFAYRALRAKNLVKAMLVISPLRPLYETWPTEIENWRLPLKVAMLHGPDKDRELVTPADVYLLNPEGLPWLAKKLKGRELPFDMLVVDESSKFKNNQAKRFKLLKKLLSKFRRRYILTGSPAPNGLLDLWAQAFILDGGDALGKFISHYRAQYFYPTGYGGYEWALIAGAEKKIYRRLAPLMTRLDARDYLKMPALVVPDPIKVRMPDAAWTVYRDLEDELLARFGGKEITAANAAVVTQKLRQVTSGGIYHDEDFDPQTWGASKKVKLEFGKRGTARGWTELHDAKVQATLDLIDELEGQPLIVAYEFNHELERLLKARPGTPYIGGGAKPAEVRDVVQRWNRGELPVLLGQPQSMAHGLNLQAGGRAVLWFSLTWNLENYDQLIRRVWRQGQSKRVF
ncbi:MAG TPA: DEAD/DEAH box helicase, partial [Methyloceanibacter sp.]|nr:DEAD/DEAH box helicase [Methyloceanibacter sp.]